jgi:hypothetical protein
MEGSRLAATRSGARSSHQPVATEFSSFRHHRALSAKLCRLGTAFRLSGTIATYQLGVIRPKVPDPWLTNVDA